MDTATMPRTMLPELPEPALSALRQTLRFGRNPYTFLAETRRELGDMFRLHILGMDPWVVVCLPELMKQVHKMPSEQVLAGRPRHASLGATLGGEMSLSMDGEDYTERRRLLNPMFSASGASKHTDDIRCVVEENLHLWPEGQLFAAQPYIDRVTLRIICRFLWGKDQRLQHLEDLAWRFLKLLSSPGVAIASLQFNLGPWSPWGRFLKVRRELHAAIEEEILERTAGRQPLSNDFLGTFIEALGADDEATRRSIAKEATAMTVAGTESTAKTIAWALLELAAQPEIYQRLQTEIDEVLGKEPIQVEHLKSMPYLEAVVYEALRFRPPGPFGGPWEAMTDLELGGYRVPRGAYIVQSLVGTGPKDLFPNPDNFDPDNFFERKVPINQWMPFGGGSRRCVGMGFALRQMPVAVATILQRMEIESSGDPLRSVRAGVVFVPSNGSPLRARWRPGWGH